jgi:uncharacterized protein (DUF2141 family)
MEDDVIALFIRLVSIVAALAIAPGLAAPADDVPQPAGGTGQLVIRLTGLGSAKAPVRIAVYNSERTWLDAPSMRYQTILDADSAKWEWTIENVPYGEYAVAAFQDRNGNGELDRGFLGAPKEPYGFSNDARGAFGPASWTEARVRLAEPSIAVTFELK